MAKAKPAARTATLRLHCRDVPGIVHRVSGFLYQHGGNILEASQHREELDDRFFMRVHFDRSKASATRKELEEGLAALAAELEMETALTFSEDRKKMAIMVSKADHCLYDLLLRDQYGEIDADIALVLGNHLTLEGVCEDFRVPFFHVPVSRESKAEAEERALELFRQHHVDFVVLARYMQIISPRVVDPYRNRILNIHHGFLPAFQGARPYHQAYRRGVKLIGATAHYVTEDLDQGPIIAQETLQVSHIHSVQGMVALGRDVERRVLASAVRAHSQDRILVYGQRTIVFD